MNKYFTKITEVKMFNAVCDICGNVIAYNCTSFGEVAKKAPIGTQFNGVGNYVCNDCGDRRIKNE